MSRSARVALGFSAATLAWFGVIYLAVCDFARSVEMMGEYPDLSNEDIEKIAAQRNPPVAPSSLILEQVEWLTCWTG